jgi:iron complex outermembrane receptor protein
VPPGSPPNTPATLISTNAARAESKGVELTLDADLGDWVDGLSVSFAGAYDYARYTDYPGATCTYAATLAGCASGYLDPPANTIPFNGKGTALSDLPDWSSTLTARYTHLLIDALKFGGTVSADMKSHMWTDYGVYNPNIGYQPGTTKINFRVTLGAPDDAWTVSLVGTNIFNVLTTEGVYNFITVNDFQRRPGARTHRRRDVKILSLLALRSGFAC